MNRDAYMKKQLRDDMPQGACTALVQLEKAYSYSRQLDIDPWEFAVGLRHLLEVGASESDLRWLIVRGYVDRADDVTTHRDAQRQFRRCENLSFKGNTCFVLRVARSAADDGLPDGNGSRFRTSPPSVSEDGVVAFVAAAEKLSPQWDGVRRAAYLRRQNDQAIPLSSAQSGSGAGDVSGRELAVCH